MMKLTFSGVLLLAALAAPARAITITTDSLPPAAVGVSYEEKVSAKDGTGPRLWSWTGSLPPGLNLGLTNGNITGTPTTAGIYSFTVLVLDLSGTDTKTLSITVNPPLSITTASLPDATIGTPYSETLSAAGGFGGYKWMRTSGALPNGLRLNESGAITGMPMVAGAFSFTVTVTDAGKSTASKSFSITVSGPPPAITTASLPNGTVGAPYSQTLSATGGSGGYSWSLASGSLPAGLSLNAAGAITGTPTAAGTASFTAQVADSGGRTASKSLTITIDPAALNITTSSLPAGQVGVAYSQSLTSSGGSGGNTWTVTGGSLPAGLNLSPTGAIGGTPTAAGLANFTVQVADNGGRTATKALTIAIDPPALTISTASLPNGTVGVAYSQSLQATGGSGGNSWTVTGGSLPAGLNLSAAGAIGGTPTAAGTANFTVQVADNGGRIATKALTIAIDPPALTVSTASLPNGTVGVAYSQTLQATGGSGGNSWTLTGGSLPAGLNVSAAGAIGGTPTAAGTANFTVQVADNGGRTATKALTIAIDPPGLTISTASLPNGTVGVAYSQTLQAAGGSGGNTWTVTSGSLPAGLNISAAGAIGGTPTGAGTANFTVQVADNGGRTATKALTIAVDPPGLTISTASLPNGTVGVAYSQTLQAAGGSGGNTWTVTSGSLPAGLNISAAGAIGGTPTAAGTANFTVQVADNGGRTATKALTIAIDPPGLSVTTASLPNGMVGGAYSQTLQAAGGSGGNTWTVASGALPAGLSLSAAGAIGGTPTTAGTANFTVQVADNGGRTATKALNIAIDSPGLTVTTASLPNGRVGVAYSQTLQAAGGGGGNTWTLADGSLPPGVSLSAAGAIGGTPTTAGTANFTVQVADNGGKTATKALTILVDPTGLTISTAALPPATVGTPYSFTLASAGGSGGNAWSITSGALPAGIALAGNGAVAGRPTAAGTSNFTAQVRDSAGATASKAFSITVSPSTLVITTQSLPSAVQGTGYSQALAVTGGSGGYQWSLDAGTLPDGLTLEAAGRITGTVTGSSSTFTIAVTDSVGASVTRNFSISVTPPLRLPTSNTLPSGVTGTAYTGTVAALGGQSPISYSLASGQLPPGLTLDSRTGALSGRPSQVGSFTFAVQARDAAGTQVQVTYTIAIANTLTVINPPVLPSGSVGVAYQGTLTAAGGTAPYSWSATAGSLPAGIAFKSDGGLEGTPTVAGNFTFTATVTDAVGGRANKEFTLTIAGPLTITTGPQLPAGVPTVPYNTTLAAAGGIAPYVWSISAGSLADGLRLDSATGAITGVPTAPTTANFTVTVADSRGATAQRAFTLTIAAGVTFTNPATLPEAIAGEPYTFTFEASGGRTPYAWRIASGDLPGGLALNAASGVIAGTPSASGTFNFSIEVADAGGLKATRVHTLVVNLPSAAALRVSGVPATLGPMQQPQVDLVIANPYPVAITGRLNLAFVPASGMPDDPSVQFSSGGRSVTFTIAANDTRAVFPGTRLLIQSGSVAGTIQFTAESLRAGSSTLPSPTSPIGTAQIPATAAVVRGVEVRRTSNGFDLLVTGATTTRELARMVVRFRPPAGATLQTPELTIELADAARGWFQASGSAQYGGLFTVTVPFSFVGGASAIESVGVLLTNGAGTSQEASGVY